VLRACSSTSTIGSRSIPGDEFDALGATEVGVGQDELEGLFPECRECVGGRVLDAGPEAQHPERLTKRLIPSQDSTDEQDPGLSLWLGKLEGGLCSWLNALVLGDRSQHPTFGLYLRRIPA
jgi:hypothetical protein